jgi:hypothetical protein
MTEFIETALRYFCRNPKCRSKLKTPVSNPREAFCARGCHSAYYRKHCRVCESEITQPTNGERKLCKKPQCRSVFTLGEGFGRYHEAATRKPIQETPVNIDALRAPKAPRWRLIAGAGLTPSQLHCATIPDGPGGQWEGGSFERIEAQNRALLKAHSTALKKAEETEIEANGYFTEPEWKEIISPDGVKCFVTRFREPSKPITAPPIPDDLSIPDFLRR